MNRSLLVLDDFLLEPQRARELMLEGSFVDTEAEGHVYPGINKERVNDIGAFDRLEEAMGAPIDPKLTFARINVDKEMPGTKVHADLLYADWATVLYLNLPEQCRGGTAFWTHKEANIDRMPNLGDPILGENPEQWRTWMRTEWDNLKAWRMSGFVEMRFNRCIIYRTSMFHSRWPLEGWGIDKENARMIWVSFFNLKT